MSVIGAIAGVAGAVGAAGAAGTLSELLSACKDGARSYGQLKNDMTSSLTAYTKQTNIMSRLYIEDTILRDDICPPLVGVLNQLYVSYVMAALNMDTLCANGRTVREMVEAVGTENYDIIKEIFDKFGSNSYNFSNEDEVVKLDNDVQRLPVGRLIELSMVGAVPVSEKETEVNNVEADSSNALGRNGQVVGKTVDVKLTTSQQTYQFKAYLYVQLVPYVLQPNVAEGYISANFNPPLRSRWQKFRAGEISFWNDFVFTRDLIKQQEKILKADKSGIITEMMMKNRSKLWKWVSGLFMSTPSHNIANSIMIISKETFTRACNNSGLKFDNFTQRQRYFNKTWSMIICVVDPMYNTVEMYFNGLDAKGTYTFDMINKVGVKGKDSFDLKEIMGAFSQGLSPKF